MMDELAVMTRRAALQRAAMLLGGAISAPTLAAVLAGCDRGGQEGAAAWTPRTLSAEQDQTLLAMAEQILPTTDTPGARAARVNEFIDRMLTDYYPEPERKRFLAGLDRADQRAQRAFGTAFREAEPGQQLQLVEALNRSAYPADGARQTAAEAAAPRDPVLQDGQNATGRSYGSEGVAASGAVALDGDWDPEDVGKDSFFRTLKELTLVGYYTSEVGATQELRVNPMGQWRADIPYSEIGRSHA